MTSSHCNPQVPIDSTPKHGWMTRVASLAAALLLIAFVALAAPQYQDRDRDHDRIRVWHERMPVDFGGGNGGRPSPDALCEEEAAAVGFHVQTGEYFNQAWLDCVHVHGDGRLGDEIRTTERTGSPGGRPVYDALCPPGFVLRGLRGRTGASIDEAVGACSPLREIADRFDRPHTEFTRPLTRPNPGGHRSEGFCPPGAVVTGFRSNSGTHMDHLWILCSELHHGD